MCNMLPFYQFTCLGILFHRYLIIHFLSSSFLKGSKNQTLQKSCAFPQNFHIWKSGEITVFFAVPFISCSFAIQQWCGWKFWKNLDKGWQNLIFLKHCFIYNTSVTAVFYIAFLPPPQGNTLLQVLITLTHFRRSFLLAERMRDMIAL